MGLKHVLFVTSGLSGTGIIDECKTNFENAGVSVSVYDKVESNPKDYNVMDAYKAFSEGECDGFVSIGGGSSHDTTKGARVVAAHDGRNVNEFQELNASETLDNPAHIAINTTVGTGSETTPAYVITDLSSPDAPHKWVGFDRAAITTLAINDPVLCMTQPPRVRGVHGLRHDGPRLRVLRRACAAPLHDTGCARRDKAHPGEFARGDLQPEQLQGDGGDGLGAVHGGPGVLDRSARHFALALARGLRLLRHPPRPEQRRRCCRGCGLTTSLRRRRGTRTSLARWA